MIRSVRRNAINTPFCNYCIEILKIPGEQVDKYRDNPGLYSDILPKLLREYLSRTCFYYDAVIVDEGQDFAPEAWEAISLLPEADGCFYIFYDPDQNIFNRELHLPDFGMPPVVLTKNCRNTKKIFATLKPYQSMNSTIMDDAPEGTDVRILRGDCRANLLDELERLVGTEQVAVNDIVILGAHSLENTSIGSDTAVGRFKIGSGGENHESMKIAYYTYMKFKGCEARVVILLDVDDSDPRWSDPNGLYTAMSRAVHQLVVLENSRQPTLV